MLVGLRVAFQVHMLRDWCSNPIRGSILFISWILNNLHYISVDLKKDCQTGPTKRENPNVGTAMRLFVSYLFERTYGSWEFFYSAALTAQNSPELHFRCINSFIQPSRVGSLDPTFAVHYCTFYRAFMLKANKKPYKKLIIAVHNCHKIDFLFEMLSDSDV